MHLELKQVRSCPQNLIRSSGLGSALNQYKWTDYLSVKCSLCQVRALKGALDGASQGVNIRPERGCSSRVFEPSRCSCMLTDGNRLRPTNAMRMHQTGSERKYRYTLTCLSKNKLPNDAIVFFQEIAEVESVCLCASETLQWGLIWQWENTTASFVNIRRQVRTVFSSVCTCKNALSLSKECVCVSRFAYMCESHRAYSLRRAPFYPLLFFYSKAAVLVSIYVPTYSLKTNMSSLAARHRLHVYTSVCRTLSHKHNSPPVMDLKAVFHLTCFISLTAAWWTH